MLGGESTKGRPSTAFFLPLHGGGGKGLSPQALVCTPLRSQAALDSAAAQQGQPSLQKGGDAPPPALHRWAAASVLLRPHQLGPLLDEEEEESHGAIFQSPPALSRVLALSSLPHSLAWAAVAWQPPSASFQGDQC